MKYIKWKTLIVTCVVCILPVFLGIALWNELPEKIAIHFNIYNQPDNFASKEFAVLGLPVMMALFQLFCCIISDINYREHSVPVKIELVTKWIIPVITLVLYIATLGYSLGWNFEIRKIAGLITGLLLIVTGNYMPKLDYVKNYDISTDKARKINRFSGFATVIMGILMIASVFMPPVATVICIFLMIPYTSVIAIYTIKNKRK